MARRRSCPPPRPAGARRRRPPRAGGGHPGRRPLAAAVRVGRREHGHTLIELLLAASLALVLFGATLAALETVTRSENRDQHWALAVQDGQAGLARMLHEIRTAYSVLATTPNSIYFLTWQGGVPAQVYYACDVAQPGTAYQQCVRLQAALGAQLPALGAAVPVVRAVQNGTLADPVFRFTPNAIAPNYVGAKVELAASDGLLRSSGLQHSIVLDAGAYLRNLNVGA